MKICENCLGSGVENMPEAGRFSHAALIPCGHCDGSGYLDAPAPANEDHSPYLYMDDGDPHFIPAA